jgi:hypothetical protein
MRGFQCHSDSVLNESASLRIGQRNIPARGKLKSRRYLLLQCYLFGLATIDELARKTL